MVCIEGMHMYTASWQMCLVFALSDLLVASWVSGATAVLVMAVVFMTATAGNECKPCLPLLLRSPQQHNKLPPAVLGAHASTT